MTFFKKLKKQNGQGLVSVMIAAGLLVLAALAVSNFLTHYNSQSQHLETSSECERVAKSVVDYIVKDQASLVIYSYGPAGAGSSNFQATSTAMKTDDGISMYNFMSAPISVYKTVPPATKMTVPVGGNSAISVPTTWMFNNYLNIRDSMNRLVALAANNMCCPSLKVNGAPGSCGQIYYQSGSATNPPGLIFGEGGTNAAAPDVSVKLGVNIQDNNNTLCGGAGGLTALPNSHDTIKANFRVGVTISTNGSAAHYCEMDGSSQYLGGTTASPYTLIDLVNKTPTDISSQGTTTPGPNSLCSNKYGNPSACGAGAVIKLNVATFTDTNGTSCRDFIKNIPTETVCGGRSGAGIGGPQDSFTMAASACTPSFPGSVFFCRIGEQSWFQGPIGQSQWEPCDQAHVWDYNNTDTGAKVAISYIRPSGASSLNTDRTTTATITLSNLPERAYMVDVRAVEVFGHQIGPSFCSLAPNCNTSGAVIPTFVVDIDNPSFTKPLASDGGFIDTVANGPTGNAGAMPPGAVAKFGGYYQCTSGTSTFSTGGITYSPSLPAGASPLGMGGTCTGKLVPAGTVGPVTGNLLDGCRVVAGAGATPGKYTLTAKYVNDCGKTAVSPPATWCYDPTTYTASAKETTSRVTPQFSLSLSKNTCGAVYQIPTIAQPAPQNFAMIAAPTTTAVVSIGDWDPIKNSGCLAYPTGSQFCAEVYDPCSRSATENISYSSTLADQPTNNSCLAVNGTPNVNGNSCDDPAAHCDSSYKCTTTYTPQGPNKNPCWNDNDCIDISTADCPGVHGTCGTTFNCIDSTNTYSAPAGVVCKNGGPGTACTINVGACTGTCNGGAKDGSICNAAADCPSGTCSNNLKNSFGKSCSLGDPTTIAGNCEFGIQTKCTAPTNSTCNPCASVSASGVVNWCPAANSCTPGVGVPGGPPASCTSSPVIPPACVITPLAPTGCVPNTACSATVKGPQPGTQTVGNSCSPAGCDPSCGTTTTTCTYNCPNCTWHFEGMEGDETYCDPNTRTCSKCSGPFGGVAPPCPVANGSACDCNTDSEAYCLVDPNEGGNCPARTYSCLP